jgi:hypothetical protein
MSHLDTAYKLGSARAVEDFTDWMTSGDANPTEAPPRLGYKIAKEVMEKLSEPKGKKVKPGSRKGGKSEPAARSPAGKGTRFKRLKSKLSKKKGVKDPGALAAAIGRSKFGKKKFQSMAAKGK